VGIPRISRVGIDGALDRSQFLADIRTAIDTRQGFAAGKLGYAEQVWLSSQWSLEKHPENHSFQRAVRASARFHACKQMGAFPSDDQYLDSAVHKLSESVKDMDYLAVHESPLIEGIVDHLELKSKLLDFGGIEPNRDLPYKIEDCYLPFLKDKRILLITTPAELLASRATKETFEATWRNIHCPWFYPASVDFLTFDSLLDDSTHNKYASSLDLLNEICSQISKREFDIAFVGASSLGIPIVDHVKSIGKVGLSLGGHLQVLFGVQGKRWRDDPNWQRAYWNEAWLEMPSEYKPIQKDWTVDDGAYW